MLLLLYKHLKIETPLCPASVKEHLGELMTTELTPQLGYSPKSQFTGEVDGDHFKIVYSDLTTRGIVCNGSIRKHQNGARISMLIRPLALISLVSIFFYVEIIRWLVILIIQLSHHQSLIVGDVFATPIIWDIVLYFTFYTLFHYETSKVKIALHKRLGWEV